MVSEEQARREICEIGRRLWQMGHTPANAGNLSVRLGENRLLCTPTGVSKGFMRPEELVLLDLEGQVIGSGQASTEILMHLLVYRARPEIAAVVHVHPPLASSFAASGIPLPCDLLTESTAILGSVPTAPLATPGTPEVPAALEPYLEGHVAFLLANHGALTIGADLFEAYYRMEVLEHSAHVALVTRQLGSTAPIPPELLAALRPEWSR